MAAHRYWRLFVRSTPANYLGAAEVSFRSAADADLSVGGTPIGVAPHGAEYPLSYAFDKTTATAGYLAQAGMPSWVGYDHVTPVEVASVLFTVFDATYSPAAGGLTLQHSDDGVVWTDEGTHLLRDDAVAYTPGMVVRFTPYAAGASVSRAVDRLAYRRAAPTPQQYPPSAKAPYAATLRRDPVDGGKFKAVVYTDVNALPADQPVAPRHVRLHDFDGQGRLVRSGWSEMVGGQAVCVFENIRQGNYYAVGFDHTGAYDAEVAANLPLEPM